MKMQKIRIFSAALILCLAPISGAKDAGFRYKDGKCVNSQGEEGLNVGYLGQCTDVRGAVVANFSFADLDLSGSKFDGTDVQGSSFQNCDLTGTSFTSAQISGADMSGAKLHNVDFSKAVLINAHLASADISAVNFDGADLSQAALSYLSFPLSSFKGTKFTGAALDSAQFANVDMTGADLSYANLTAIDFSGAILDTANLAQANLIRANLTKAHATKAKFSGAVLRQAQMSGAVLSMAEMRTVQGEGADFTSANLSQADLRGAAFANAHLDGADLTGVKISKKTILPLTPDEAKNRGVQMIAAAVLILWDQTQDDPEITALMKYFDTQGVDATLSSKGRAAFDGTVDLTPYQYILQLYGHTDEMMAAGQLALKQFVQGGGVYISTGMMNHMFGFHNDLQGMTDLIATPSAQGGFVPASALKVADGQQGNPLVTGLEGAQSNCNFVFADAVTKYADNPAQTILSDADGNPIIVARNFGEGRIVNLAMISSGDSNYPCLTDAVAQQMILNTVNW